MQKKLIALASLLIIGITGFSQAHFKYTGSWEGTLDLGIQLRIVFHIKSEGAGLITTADSPDQGAFGFSTDATTVEGNTITIEMKNLKASFAGRLTSDSTIEGTFTQLAETPLKLKKVDKPSVRKRPQTPVAPFPYKAEDVKYTNADQSISFGATITIPEGNGPFPAAVLITGSGPQDRDEELLGHKLFAVLSDHLTRKGFIVLRVDDRGVGQSTGDFDSSTSADFANDVEAGVNYLLTRTEVDKKKLGLIGHSEGGMIAPIVASRRKDIDFVVLLAGPGIKIMDLMAEQSAAILRSNNLSEKAIAAYSLVYKDISKELVNNTDSAVAVTNAQNLMSKWAAVTDTGVLKEIQMDTEQSRKAVVISLAKVMGSPWFRYFLNFDPAPYLGKLKAKVLAINGEKDIQVLPASNLAGIKAALQKAKNKNAEIITLPGLNHLFQTCKTCTIQEYGELEESFSPAALKIVSDWMTANVK